MLVILVKAHRSKLRILIIMLRLSDLEVSVYLNISWVRGTQIIFAVPISNFCLLPTTTSLHPLALVVVMPVCGLFHNSVLVAALSESCLPAPLTVSKVLKLMTRLVVVLALIIQNKGYRHAQVRECLIAVNEDLIVYIRRGVVDYYV